LTPESGASGIDNGSNGENISEKPLPVADPTSMIVNEFQ
jgi:hypothetical protein